MLTPSRATRVLQSSALMLALLSSGAALAGTAEGIAAYDQADYATALRELQSEESRGDPDAQNTSGNWRGRGRRD